MLRNESILDDSSNDVSHLTVDFDFNVSLIQTIVIIDFRFEFGLDLDN